MIRYNQLFSFNLSELVHIKHYLLPLFVVVAMRIQNGSLVWKNNSRKEPKLMAKYSWRISKMYLESDRSGDVCAQQFDRILSSCLYRAYLLTFVCSLQIWWSGLKLKIVDWLIYSFLCLKSRQLCMCTPKASEPGRGKARGGGGSFFAKLDITPWFFCLSSEDF